MAAPGDEPMPAGMGEEHGAGLAPVRGMRGVLSLPAPSKLASPNEAAFASQKSRRKAVVAKDPG